MKNDNPPPRPWPDAERHAFSAKMWVAAQGAERRMKALEAVAAAARAYRSLIDYDHHSHKAALDALDAALQHLKETETNG